MKRWLRNLILRWLELADHEGRLLDVERHFVTKRDAQGDIVETLADVPLAKRREIKPKTKGMSWPQRKAYLEATDGERRAVVGERLPSTS